MVDYHKAIRALHPEVVKVEENNDSINAYDADGNLITWDKTAADAWVDPEAYKFARKEAYAPLAEQLDMQYHDTMNGTETWLDHINEVKAKYPKPTE